MLINADQRRSYGHKPVGYERELHLKSGHHALPQKTLNASYLYENLPVQHTVIFKIVKNEHFQ